MQNTIDSSITSAKSFVKFKFVKKTLSSVTIGEHVYPIGKVLGKSRAIVFNIKSGKPMCLKIARHGDIKLNERKLEYLRNHTDDFTAIYDYVSDVPLNRELILNGVNLTDRVDICVLEKVDLTLDKLCDMIRTRKNFSKIQFSVEFLSYLTIKLIIIANNLLLNHLCYADIKAANIGINIRNNKVYVKLIDVDTIDASDTLFTWHTSGRISPNINIKRIQYLNIFFTIFSLLFLNQPSQMCSSNYSEFYKDGNIYNYMSWFNDDSNRAKYSSWFSKGLKCTEYKYALLVGTYKIIVDSFENQPLTLQKIFENYGEIVRNVSTIITRHYNISKYDSFFTFISQCLVIMVLLFVCPPEHVLYIVNNVLQAPPHVIATRSQGNNANGNVTSNLMLYTHVNEVTENDLYEYIMLDSEVSMGISIVNILRKYATSICIDETCSALKEYGELFLNIDK